MSATSSRWITMATLVISLFLYGISAFIGQYGVILKEVKDDGTEDKDMNRAIQAITLLGMALLTISAITAICLRHGEKERGDGVGSFLGYMFIGFSTFLAVACGIATLGMAGSVAGSQKIAEMYLYPFSFMVISLLFALVGMVTAFLLGCPNVCGPCMYDREPRDPRDMYKGPPPGSFNRRAMPPGYGYP